MTRKNQHLVSCKVRLPHLHEVLADSDPTSTTRQIGWKR